MEIISIGNHTLIKRRRPSDYASSLIVCGRLNEEKPKLDVEEVGEVHGYVPIPMDDNLIHTLTYVDKKNPCVKCERIRIAIVEGTVEELRQLSLGKCRIVMEEEAKQ